MAARKGLVFAMEEMDNTPTGDDTSVPEAQAEVEAGVAEMGQEVDTVEDLNEAVEDAVEDADTLGDISDVMAESVDKGEGLDETSAQMAEVAIESICNRLGINTDRRVMPGMESFGSKSSRVQATRVAMESIMDKVKTIWQAIKKAFLQVWQKIKDFFASFFSNTEKVTKYAESLKEKIRNTKGEKKEDKVKAPAIGRAFNIDGKASFASLNTIVGNHSNFTKAFLGMKDSLAEGATILEAALRKEEPGNGDKLADAFEKIIKIAAITGSVEKKEEDGKKISLAKAGPFISGESYVMSYSRKEGDAAWDCELEFRRDPAEKKGEEEVPTLELKDATAVCDTVIGLMKSTADFKKAQGSIEAINKACMKVVDSAIGLADTMAKESEAGSKTSGILSMVRKAVTSLNTVSTRLVMLTPAQNVQVGKAALTYVADSLAVYKEKEADSKK